MIVFDAYPNASVKYFLPTMVKDQLQVLAIVFQRYVVNLLRLEFINDFNISNRIYITVVGSVINITGKQLTVLFNMSLDRSKNADELEECNNWLGP